MDSFLFALALLFLILFFVYVLYAVFTEPKHTRKRTRIRNITLI